jgi:DNA-binding MarR family transcriptional regulator
MLYMHNLIPIILSSDIENGHSMSTTTASTPDQHEALNDLPPSAKLVAKVLEYNGTLSQSDIADETLLPARTVRYALGRLEDHGVVESRHSFADARKRLYTIAE